MGQSEALVAIDTLAHGVLSDLLSATGNNMDITLLAPNIPNMVGQVMCFEVLWRLESDISRNLRTASEVLARLPGQAAASHTVTSLQPAVLRSKA